MDRCLVLQRDGDWSAADLRSPSFGKPGVSIADSRLGTKSQAPHSALYAAEEGALDAVAATHALIAGAQAYGAKILTQTRVLGFVTQSATVTGVETTIGIVDADIVVLAAGTGITKLTDMLGVSLPIEASPAIFIRYKSQPNLVHTLISSPEMEVRQSSNDALLAAEDYLDDAMENQPAAIALRTAKTIRNELHGVISIDPERACIGLRPMPADGIPIITPSSKSCAPS